MRSHNSLRVCRITPFGAVASDLSDEIGKQIANQGPESLIQRVIGSIEDGVQVTTTVRDHPAVLEAAHDSLIDNHGEVFDDPEAIGVKRLDVDANESFAYVWIHDECATDPDGGFFGHCAACGAEHEVGGELEDEECGCQCGGDIAPVIDLRDAAIQE